MPDGIEEENQNRERRRKNDAQDAEYSIYAGIRSRNRGTCFVFASKNLSVGAADRVERFYGAGDRHRKSCLYYQYDFAGGGKRTGYYCISDGKRTGSTASGNQN